MNYILLKQIIHDRFWTLEITYSSCLSLYMNKPHPLSEDADWILLIVVKAWIEPTTLFGLADERMVHQVFPFPRLVTHTIARESYLPYYSLIAGREKSNGTSVEWNRKSFA